MLRKTPFRLWLKRWPMFDDDDAPKPKRSSSTNAPSADSGTPSRPAQCTMCIQSIEGARDSCEK